MSNPDDDRSAFSLRMNDPDPRDAVSYEGVMKAQDKIERALVFGLTKHSTPPDRRGAMAGSAFALVGYGNGWDYDMEGCIGRDEFGVALAAPNAVGLWLWEGVPLWVEERSEGILEGCVPEYDRAGTWRRLTDGEAAAFAAGTLDLHNL